MALTVNIIGAGKLGKTIGCLFHKKQLLSIGGICNSSLESSKKAVDFIGAGIATDSIKNLPPADITLITTPDQLIEITCQILSTSQHLKSNSIVAHCSGALTSEILSSAQLKNCSIASIHPMMSFSDPQLSIQKYQDIFCAAEGDKQALEILMVLFDQLGSMCYEIKRDKKVLYHAGSAFASNYLVAIAKIALTSFQKADIETEKAMNIVTSLMKGTIFNLEQHASPEKTLTGPIQRGDLKTIEKHLNELKAIELDGIYAQLGKITLELTSLNEEVKQSIHQVLLKG